MGHLATGASGHGAGGGPPEYRARGRPVTRRGAPSCTPPRADLPSLSVRPNGRPAMRDRRMRTMRTGRVAAACLFLLSLAPGLYALPPPGTCLYSWKPVSDGDPMKGVNHHVWDLAVAPEGSPLGPAVYACGNFTQADGTFVNHIAKWNGTQWSPLSGPSGNGLNDVCFSLALGG